MRQDTELEAATWKETVEEVSKIGLGSTKKRAPPLASSLANTSGSNSLAG